MDQLQEKLMKLELAMIQIKEYPPHLMNCLKYNKVFDPSYTNKDPVAEMRVEIALIRSGLQDFKRGAEEVQTVLQEVISIAEGNKPFFDDLMKQYGITEEVAELLGGEEQDDDQDTTEGHSEIDPEEENTFQLKKGNLAELQRTNGNSGRDNESPILS